MGGAVKFWILGGLIAIGILLLNDRMGFESIQVISSSMEPTLLANERVFLNHFIQYSSPSYRRYDVVVIRHPQYPKRMVKRIVGMPGDCLRLVDGYQVEYQQEPMDVSPETIQHYHSKIQLKSNPKFHFDTLYAKDWLCLNEGEYYVLGDNRLASEDSRVFGIVSSSWMQGVLTRIWYSFEVRPGQTYHRGIRWDRLWKRVE